VLFSNRYWLIVYLKKCLIFHSYACSSSSSILVFGEWVMERSQSKLMDIRSKIIDPSALADRLSGLRSEGKRVVFTNGCFDIIHIGHVRYLSAAKNEGDLLVVGLNSDQSVRRIKGKRRPIVKQQQRSEILASLQVVDYVTLFDEPDPLKLIQLLKPSILVKGEDWSEDTIIGADIVKANGGRVVRVPLVGDASTSGIIERIVKHYC
jgi:rfaE bifunctional protein nucleotidyltransferase chain/domain